MNQQVYALVHEENGAIGISFPDFPGCISGGKSVEEALMRGQEILAFHIAGMIADGDPLPRLRNLDELRKDSDFREAAQGATLTLVPIELPDRVVQANIA